MLKSFKTEINPTVEQKIKINKTIGTCRYVYNFYLGHNKALYDKGEKFMTGKSFSVWLNNEYIPNNPDKIWIKEAYSKAVKRSIENGCTAFTRFFKHQSDFPKFKKKGKSDVKMYFVKNNPKDCRCERHRLNIPTLGWVRIKEKGYIPTTKDGWKIKSGTISVKAGRYYVSVLVEIPDIKVANNSNDGMGIDLGLKDLAIVSNGKTYKNINKSASVKKLEKKLRREQRRLSRKYENLKKGESTQKNIQKQKLKVQRLHQKILRGLGLPILRRGGNALEPGRVRGLPGGVRHGFCGGYRQCHRQHHLHPLCLLDKPHLCVQEREQRQGGPGRVRAVCVLPHRYHGHGSGHHLGGRQPAGAARRLCCGQRQAVGDGRQAVQPGDRDFVQLCFQQIVYL